MKKSQKTDQIEISDIFIKPNEENCLLYSLFKIPLFSPDWEVLKQSLSCIDGLVTTFKRIEWIVQMKLMPCPLVFAAGSGNLSDLKELANVRNINEVRSCFWETALIAASKMGHLNVVKFVLELNSTDEHCNLKDNRGWNAFFNAVYNGHLEIVKYLVGKSKPLKETLFQSIILAACNGHTEIIKYVMELVKPGKISPQHWKSAALKSLEFGHLETLKFIIPHLNLSKEINIEPTISPLPFCLSFQSKKQLNLLMAAAHVGHVEIVKYLCEVHNYSINTVDLNGKTALMYAARSGNLEVVKYLFDRDPEMGVNGTVAAGPTLLMATITSNDCFEVFRFLYDKTQKEEIVFRCYRNGWHALHYAARFGHLEIVKLICGGNYNNGELPTDEKLSFIRMKTNTSKTAVNLASDYEFLYRSNNRVMEGRKQVCDYLEPFFTPATDVPSTSQNSSKVTKVQKSATRKRRNFKDPVVVPVRKGRRK